jgi:hypothetical protein
LDPAHKTWERDTLPDGTMICRWIMPYQKSGKIILQNLGSSRFAVGEGLKSS